MVGKCEHCEVANQSASHWSTRLQRWVRLCGRCWVPVYLATRARLEGGVE